MEYTAVLVVILPSSNVLSCEPQVKVSERGEPKSGTGFMFEWAGGALIHACDYLTELFGEFSCKIDMRVARGGLADLKYMQLTFQPDLGRGTARCPCYDVDR